MTEDMKALLAIGDAIAVLGESKPGDRGAADRYYAIAITELEKVYAFVNTFICGAEPADYEQPERAIEPKPKSITPGEIWRP